MGKTNINWQAMSDAAIIAQIGSKIKQLRLGVNKTQLQLAQEAGLNRWTISQIEKGESTSLITLIKILRVLDALYVLNEFQEQEEISPMLYVKMQKKQRKRANGNQTNEPDTDLGW